MIYDDVLNLLNLAARNIDYTGPVFLVFLIFFSKLVVGERFKAENLKRLFLETSVDVMSLAESFVLSFVILVSKNITTPESLFHATDFLIGSFLLLAYIFPLMLVIYIVKTSIANYGKSGKNIAIFIGFLIAWPVSAVCLGFSIYLLRTVGGV